MRVGTGCQGVNGVIGDEERRKMKLRGWRMASVLLAFSGSTPLQDSSVNALVRSPSSAPAAAQSVRGGFLRRVD